MNEEQRSARFHKLLGLVHDRAWAVLNEPPADIPLALYEMHIWIAETREIASEVSLEALEKVIGK